MSDPPRNLESLRTEVEYYKRQLDDLAGENLRLHYAMSGLRHELRQKRQGFALLSALQQSIGAHKQISSIFEITIRAINSTLGMDKTVVLFPTDKPNVYRMGQWLGVREEVATSLASLDLEFPDAFATGTGLLIATARSSASSPSRRGATLATTCLAAHSKVRKIASQ